VTERLLLIEDDPRLADMVREYLGKAGFHVTHAENGSRGLALHGREPVDAVILDLMLPDMNGYSVCEELRRNNAVVPIIMLTARSQESDKIRGLDAGADDYVTKPFSVNELLARVRANLRRVAAAEPAPSEPIQAGDFYINPESRQVRVSGKEIHLTPKEFDLLAFMARHPNKVLTHRVLLNAVWGGESVQQPEYLRVFINQLRKKIEPADTPRYILTDPWVGYRFQPGGESE